MAAGPPDLVDSAQLAGQGAVLERSYELDGLPRLADLLADPQGVVRARFAFSTLPSGRAGARIEVHAEPRLRCQRCMSGFVREVDGDSRVEFVGEETAQASDDERETCRTENGRVSLRDLAEEEMLLALPIVPACEAPQECGNVPSLCSGVQGTEGSDPTSRPFGGLKEMLKKRDRT